MPSIYVSEENYSALLDVENRLQKKQNRRVSHNAAITYLISVWKKNQTDNNQEQ